MISSAAIANARQVSRNRIRSATLDWITGEPAVHLRHANGTEAEHPSVPGEVSVDPNGTAITTFTFEDPGVYEFAEVQSAFLWQVQSFEFTPQTKRASRFYVTRPGIYDVGTLPERRHRGIGSAITRVSLTSSDVADATIGALGASLGAALAIGLVRLMPAVLTTAPRMNELTRQLTDQPRVNWTPFFHPDGQVVVYAANVGGHGAGTPTESSRSWTSTMTRVRAWVRPMPME